MDIFIFAGLTLFFICSLIVLIVALMCWSIGQDTGRGDWDY